jgi:hypothetical protein
MAKSAKRQAQTSKGLLGPPNPQNRRKFNSWLAKQPQQWSVVIAARAALRALPLAASVNDPVVLLAVLRATAVAWFAAKYPNRGVESAAAAAADAARNAATGADTAAGAAAAAITPAAYVGYSADDAATAAAAPDATTAATAAGYGVAITAHAYADSDAAVHAAVKLDAQRLHDRVLTADQLARDRLWGTPEPAVFSEKSQQFGARLRAIDKHWQVWVDWYQNVAAQEPYRGITEAEDATYTDMPGELPWEESAEAVNTEIARRLAALKSDPSPIEGIPSPIAISRRPDGRIGADAGALGAPTLPGSPTPEDQSSALAACRSRAEQLRTTAVSPRFQGRSEYAEALAAYLEWLPATPGSGNILLADGEARVLNKLFTADEGVLLTGFAGRLSVLLEDHIGLRPHYPELERHYHAVRTGRLVTPLSRDAVEAIRQAIHANTPDVFHESVFPAMDETAKPIPDVRPPAPEDAPPPDPSRPKPPKDPIAEVDPAKSRSFVFASAANRIWEILKSGKNLHEGADGWQKTYEQFKPHIGPLIDWLKYFVSGGGDGTPPMPPMMSA